MATTEKIHIIQAKTTEELEEAYNQWARKQLKKVGVEIIDRQFSQSSAGYQVAIFYKEVIL